jgi:hypothetical protein
MGTAGKTIRSFLDRKNFKTVAHRRKSRNSIRHPQDGSPMIIGGNQQNGRDTDLYIADRESRLDENADGGEERILVAVVGRWSKTLALIRTIRRTSRIRHLRRRTRKIYRRQQGEKVRTDNGIFASGGPLRNPDAVGGSRTSTAEGLGHLPDLTADVSWDVNGLVDPFGRLRFRSMKMAQTGFVISQAEAKKPSAANPKCPWHRLIQFSEDPAPRLPLARPDAPADAYSVKLETGELTRWTYSEVGGLNPATFVTPTRIRFKSFEREIPARLQARARRAEIFGADQHPPAVG